MNEKEIYNSLSALPLNGLRFFAQTASTNDAALAWAAEGAQDFSLVCADEQTRGRGRGSHQWITPAGVSLAFSLILRPRGEEASCLQLFTALGAVAVCEAVEALGLQPEIKWPNDVLLGGRKFCGVLVDTAWMDEEAEVVVVGIGVNVSSGSVPPPEGLAFPATCLEQEAGKPVNRLRLMREILHAVVYWRGLMAGSLFLRTWERHLAFRGEMVAVDSDGGQRRLGRVEGLEADGSLRLSSPEAAPFTVQFGEIRIQPVV